MYPKKIQNRFRKPGEKSKHKDAYFLAKDPNCEKRRDSGNKLLERKIQQFRGIPLEGPGYLGKEIKAREEACLVR